MPLPLAVLLPLLAQVGPTGTQIEAPLDIPRRKPVHAAAPSPAMHAPSRLAVCLSEIETSPAKAVDLAQAWRGAARGLDRAEAGQCLGQALAAQAKWSEAEAAFLAARIDAATDQRAERARLGAMAANAALAEREPERALEQLDLAHGDALGAGDLHLAGDIAIDRARALVALKRENDAGAALAEARANAPEKSATWLLSATLARRQGKLNDAQTFIEKAAAIAPLDPEIGLEAGVIAVLGGRDAAARRSWNSVIATAPGSDLARIAKQYLDQLGPDTAPETR